MSEKDVVYSKINIIKNCLMAIEKVKKNEKEPDFRQGLFELNLQRAIQACIDLANVVIAKEGLGLPNTYRQSFEILEKFQVIDSTIGTTMKSMVGFRNISIHDYEEIKPEIINGIVEKRLTDFEKFYEMIFNRAQGW
ncbi:DUF86 domain-containing protein [bacterium]|nr:DUF86 domain-containing protein [bacterium]